MYAKLTAVCLFQTRSGERPRDWVDPACSKNLLENPRRAASSWRSSAWRVPISARCTGVLLDVVPRELAGRRSSAWCPDFVQSSSWVCCPAAVKGRNCWGELPLYCRFHYYCVLLPDKPTYPVDGSVSRVVYCDCAFVLPGGRTTVWPSVRRRSLWRTWCRLLLLFIIYRDYWGNAV